MYFLSKTPVGKYEDAMGTERGDLPLPMRHQTRATDTTGNPHKEMRC